MLLSALFCADSSQLPCHARCSAGSRPQMLSDNNEPPLLCYNFNTAQKNDRPGHKWWAVSTPYSLSGSIPAPLRDRDTVCLHWFELHLLNSANIKLSRGCQYSVALHYAMSQGFVLQFCSNCCLSESVKDWFPNVFFLDLSKTVYSSKSIL